MSDRPAIIITHQGDSFYLAHTIAQTRQSNPRSRLILLGDEAYDYYLGVEHYDYRQYSSEANRLGTLYRHRNAVDEHHEWLRFYFQKWVMIRNFIRQEKLPSTFIIDSNVLLYADLAVLQEQLEHPKFTVSQIELDVESAAGG
ncbi:MAG: hypothetical protein AAGA45_04175, partial [Verrucomicrobiota bacterium]